MWFIGIVWFALLDNQCWEFQERIWERIGSMYPIVLCHKHIENATIFQRTIRLAFKKNYVHVHSRESCWSQWNVLRFLYRILLHVCAQQCTLLPTEPLFTVRLLQNLHTAFRYQRPRGMKIKNRGRLCARWLGFHAGGIMIKINETKSLRAH